MVETDKNMTSHTADAGYVSYGSPIKAETVETPANLRDKYTFISKLGEGSQGNVFKATRNSDGKVVAIKKLRIDSVSTWKEYDLFHREADVLSQIHDPCVAGFYEALEFLNEEKPAAYIVQELIEGRSLYVMLKTGFRFTVSRIFNMAYSLVVLLEKLHTHNPPIIHRDIKPNNIIMRPRQDADDFEPCLIDFGAVANPTVQKGGSTTAGTYGYMPPEQLIGRPCPASDIYSLGATIVYMLTGVEPAEMRISDFRLIIDPYLENIPRPVVNVLHQMLDPKPETRLADYEKLKSIFARFAKDDYAIEAVESNIDPNRINEQLCNVNGFNQAGNLDLWMNLPEQTPRIVPRAFTETIINLEKFQNIALMKRDAKMSITGALIACLIMVAIGIAAIFWLNETFIGVIMLGISVALFGFLTLDRAITRNQIKKQRQQIAMMNQQYNSVTSKTGIELLCGYENMADVPILTLLKFGRKAIATIIDFEDQPIAPRYRVYDEFTHRVTSQSRVPFRLRYRFNPPDDASPDDLIHCITIYNHQSEGLEPGTPIPILYYIDPEDNSNVLSMPYPFPFKEIRQTQLTLVNKENLYCRTKGTC